MDFVEQFQQQCVVFDPENIAKIHQNSIQGSRHRNLLTVSAPPPIILILRSLTSKGT